MATELIRRPLDKPEMPKGMKTIGSKNIQEIGSVLGYTLLGYEVDTLRRVADIFAQLEIEPLETQRVEQYKKERAKALTKTRNSYYGQTMYYTKGVWLSVPLRGYKKPVPAFALMRASTIAKSLQAAGIKGEFKVEELRKTHSSRYYDPFMVLEVAGKKIYTDVWEEPKFEGRRTL